MGSRSSGSAPRISDAGPTLLLPRAWGFSFLATVPPARYRSAGVHGTVDASLPTVSDLNMPMLNGHDLLAPRMEPIYGQHGFLANIHKFRRRITKAAFFNGIAGVSRLDRK